MRRVAIGSPARPIRNDDEAFRSRNQDAIKFVEKINAFDRIEMFDEMRRSRFFYGRILKRPTCLADVENMRHAGKGDTVAAFKTGAWIGAGAQVDFHCVTTSCRWRNRNVRLEHHTTRRSDSRICVHRTKNINPESRRRLDLLASRTTDDVGVRP